MENIYSTAKICDYKNQTKCDLALEPEITELLMKSRDPEELKFIWTQWRKATGEKMKTLYIKYVELSNMVATLNNYSDNMAYKIKDYEADDFPEQIGKLNVEKSSRVIFILIFLATLSDIYFCIKRQTFFSISNSL